MLEQIILDDFNTLLAKLENPEAILLQEEKKEAGRTSRLPNQSNALRQQIKIFKAKKDRAYEDYCDGLISKEDFIRYRKRYEDKIQAIEQQITFLHNPSAVTGNSATDEWLTQLLQKGHLNKLTRNIVIEMVEQIDIYQDHTIKVIYNHSPF